MPLLRGGLPSRSRLRPFRCPRSYDRKYLCDRCRGAGGNASSCQTPAHVRILARHTCRLHPLGRNTTTCNLSHTLHFRGVNNTSGFPGFAARASVYLQTPLGGLPAWRIRNPQLQPSSSNCSQIFCNRSRASPIAAGYLVLQRRSAAIADTLIFLAAYFSNTTCNWAGELHGGFANLQLQPSERTHLKVALLTKRHSRGFVQVADTLAAAGRCSRDQLRRRWLCWRCARTQLRRRVVRALHGVPERRRA